MLKKRSRAVEKDQSEGKLMSDSAPSPHLFSDFRAQKTGSNSFFRVPGLFVSLNTKSISDKDSAVWSPTSPLDYKAFSNLGSPRVSSPVPDGHPKSWDSNRVGLGLVDTLNDEAMPSSGRVLRFSESKKALVESQARSNIPSLKNHLDASSGDASIAAAKSLPKTCGFSLQTPIGSSGLKLDCQKVIPESDRAREEPGKSGDTLLFCSMPPFTRSVHYDSKTTAENFMSRYRKSSSSSPPLVRGDTNVDNVSGSRWISNYPPYAASENRGCIISNGSKPPENKLTRDGRKSSWEVKCSEDSPISPHSDFLNFCYHCEKKLKEGEDIYIYKGEKAFCSSECRAEEILIEEETE